MGITICFANNKGGVCKTTTTAAIGHAWSRMGKKILFIDLDSQASLTSLVSNLEPDQHVNTIRDAFLDSHNLTIEHINDNIDLIPSDLSLSNFDRDTAALTGREYLLSDLIAPLKSRYDFILIDCPPALGLVTYNAFIASDHLVMVSTADGPSYSGLVMIANLYQEIRSNTRLNPNLKLTGVIIAKYKKNKLQDMYCKKIKEELGQVFIDPVIPEATKIAQAGSFYQDIYEYDPEGKATKAYYEISQELAMRILAE